MVEFRTGDHIEVSEANAIPLNGIEHRFVLNVDPHPLLGMQVSIWVAPVHYGEVSMVEYRLTSGNARDYGLHSKHLLSVLVAEAEQYTEQNVLLHFSQNKKPAKTLTEFVLDTHRKKALESYADRHVHSWLERAVTLDVLWTQGIARKGIIASHAIAFRAIQDPLQLTFLKETEGIRYQLQLYYQNQRVPLLGRKVQVLAGPSGWAILDQWLLQLADAPAALLKPFTEKEEIFIPEKHVPVFMRAFLLKASEKADVVAKGFRIIDHKKITGKRIGLIQDIFSGQFILRLSFAYDDIWFPAYETRSKKQRLAETADGEYVIHRYQRDPEGEKSFAAELIPFGLRQGTTGTYSFSNPSDGMDLASSAEWILDNYPTLLASGWQIEPLYAPQGTLVLERPVLKENNPLEGMDWFDLQIQVVVGETIIPFVRLKGAFAQQTPFFRLEQGTCFLIPREWFLTYADWFTLAEVVEDALRFTKAQFRAIREKEENKPLRASEFNTPIPVLFTVPKELKATLRPYQQEGFSWLAGLYHAGMGACLADDMGLGKTIQTITLLLHIQEEIKPVASENKPGQLDLFAPVQKGVERPSLRCLIIAPSTLLYNWQSELLRFAPNLRVHLHSGTDREKDQEKLLQKDVIITSYALVVRDANLFAGLPLRCAILDESHYIKNKDSKTYHAVHQLNTQVRITLTGTPIENSLSDLWSQMHFINPGLLGSATTFRNHYITPIEKKGDKEKMKTLRQFVQPYLLRRRKEDVAKDLPELTEQVLYCSMTDQQAEAYHEERNAVRQLLLAQKQAGHAVGAPVVLNALMRLRQIANCPAILPEYADIPSGKVETICAELDTIAQSGHQALLFSAFLKHLKIYKDWLDKAGISYDTLTGEDSPKAKQEAERALQENKVSFLLMTLKAGGAGLNLTGADYVLLADPWWNPAVERQAIGRAHRIGQTRPVIALRFISRDTIEEKIVTLQKRKQQWSDDLLEDQDFLGGLNEMELEELVT